MSAELVPGHQIFVDGLSKSKQLSVKEIVLVNQFPLPLSNAVVCCLPVMGNWQRSLQLRFPWSGKTPAFLPPGDPLPLKQRGSGGRNVYEQHGHRVGEAIHEADGSRAIHVSHCRV